MQLLETFVKTCQRDPSVLHLPDIAFCESLGLRIPLKRSSPLGCCGGQPHCHEDAKPEKKEEEEEADMESPESDLEIEQDGVVLPYEEVPHTMGDKRLEPLPNEPASTCVCNVRKLPLSTAARPCSSTPTAMFYKSKKMPV